MIDLFDTWRRRRRRRQSHLQIAQLSDHLLADIGIARSDVRFGLRSRAPIDDGSNR